MDDGGTESCDPIDYAGRGGARLPEGREVKLAMRASCSMHTRVAYWAAFQPAPNFLGPRRLLFQAATRRGPRGIVAVRERIR